MLAYFNNSFIPEDEISIKWNDRGYNFADGCYEVVRSYRGNIFRAHDHAKRLAYSLNELEINSDAPAKMEEIAVHLLNENHKNHEHALVYFQVTRGASKRMHRYPTTPVPPTFLATSSAFTPYNDEFEKGAAIILVEDYRWSRCDIKSIGLIPNVMSQQKARENNAIEAVFVRNGMITEGTHTNVGCVKKGVFITPPLSRHILAGVSRAAVIEICNELNIQVVEKEISEIEFLNMDELMIIGTTLEITPVVKVNKEVFSGGVPGEITRRLQKEFRKKTGL
jgi:D-alanine transaminase